MAWKTLDEMQLSGKKVLTRVDINVPVADGVVTDTTRIDRIVPTVKDILAAGGKPILLAHFGRPKGARVPEMSLQQLVPALEAAFGTKVMFAADCVGPAAEAAAAEEAPIEEASAEELLTTEGFDATKVGEMIDGSSLDDATKTALKAAADAAANNPALLQIALDQIKAALGM